MGSHSSMESPSSGADLTSPARKSLLLGQRRSFLVNKRYQLRASLLTATVVLVLLVFMNLILYSTTMRSAEQVLADAPELAAVIKAQDRIELYLIILASFVYLLGVFMITILETHRTAGAAHNLKLRLAELRRGQYKTELRLRKGDNLRDLESAFNAMTRSLQDRTWEDVETLGQLALEAESLSDAPDTRQLAKRLRDLADAKRSMVD